MEGRYFLLVAPTNSKIKLSFSSMVLRSTFPFSGVKSSFEACAYYREELDASCPLTFSQTSLVIKGGSITIISKVPCKSAGMSSGLLKS